MLAGGVELKAQWMTQSIPLKAGWNSVYLFVDPEPSSLDEIFASSPISPRSVRAYRQDFSSIEFSAASTNINTAPQWLSWWPAGSEVGFSRSLFALRPGRAYFVEMPAGVPPTNWLVKGRAMPRTVEWRVNAFNLVGFPLDAGNAPTFASFFDASAVHSNRPLYRMDTNGIWSQVSNLATTRMASGEAFWTAPSTNASSYQGPIRVVASGNGQLDFGLTVGELSVNLYNDSGVARTVRVSRADSEPQPASVTGTVQEGQVPLSYWRGVVASNSFGWLDLSQTTVVVPARGSYEFRIAVRRSAMNPLSPRLNGRYESLLRIDDLGGPNRHTLPVVARGMEVYDRNGQPQNPYSGMWVGYASVKRVNQPASPTAPSNPVPAATEFNFRLIVHVDQTGQARLLPWVIQMFKPGTLSPDPNSPELNNVDEPGRTVWVANRTYIPQFQGVTLRDGEPVGRRLSSAVFTFDAPLALAGAGTFGTNVLTASFTNQFNDRLNPFKHIYHPDHDNLDARFENQAAEAFTYARHFTFAFSAQDPDGSIQPGWGETAVGGVYRETITGVHRSPLLVEGTFRLNLIDRVATLNDGLGL
jgi:hypothetical protein